jgi:hypothetical protein
VSRSIVALLIFTPQKPPGPIGHREHHVSGSKLEQANMWLALTALHTCGPCREAHQQHTRSSILFSAPLELRFTSRRMCMGLDDSETASAPTMTSSKIEFATYSADSSLRCVRDPEPYVRSQDIISAPKGRGGTSKSLSTVRLSSDCIQTG